MNPTLPPPRFARHFLQWLTRRPHLCTMSLALMSDHLRRDLGMPRGVVDQREIRTLDYAKHQLR